MADYLTPTTELQAVNSIIAAISESPVESIVDGEMGADIELALHLLRTITRAVQLKGWYWNTEEDYELTPDVSNNINLPANTLKVDPSGSDRLKQYVQRGSRLYDRETFSFTITEVVKVNLVVLLGFTDLPEAARHYITVRSTRQFQDRVMGDDAIHMFTSRDENDAWKELLDAEGEYADYNLGSDDPDMAFLLGRHLRRRY
jgi:hypothetical protein